MNRFAPDMMDFTHKEANRWLRELMVNLKRMVLIEENYQPFTIEFLNEWTDKHHDDINSCADWLSSYKQMVARGVSDMLIPEHINAVIFFNKVVLDLKLIVLGRDPMRPFTEERLTEADQHYSDIVQCRKTRTIFYR